MFLVVFGLRFLYSLVFTSLSCLGSSICAHSLPYCISSGVRCVASLVSVGLYSQVLSLHVIFSSLFGVVCSSMGICILDMFRGFRF